MVCQRRTQKGGFLRHPYAILTCDRKKRSRGNPFEAEQEIESRKSRQVEIKGRNTLSIEARGMA